jgi:hypothetical protein
MSKLKKMYREWFGIREQSDPLNIDPDKTKESAAAIDALNTSMKSLKQTMTEDEIEEAQLVNNITDYRGGVEYVLRDPSDAQAVAQEIKDWTIKKGFTIIKHSISKSGKIGYFYFRLGQDPALESQKIQGYLSQKPELKHFRFNVKGQSKPKPRPETF